MEPAALLARPIAGLVAVRDSRAPLRVLIASLAPGGAERIVLEWLAAEAARGRAIELAVLHARRNSLPVPDGIPVRRREREEPGTFLRALARDWSGAPAPVSTHLVPDPYLEILWEAGLRTVPVVHNARAGWRNDPASWPADRVPLVLACADAVASELLAAGSRAPIVAMRHRPRVGAAAFDAQVRREARAGLGIAPGTFLIAAVGALKPQKDYARAVEVMARLSRHRDCALVILGGVLDRAGLAQLHCVVQAALALGVAPRLRLPGFVPVIEPFLAASDALLNVSRFEGLSMAVQEALAAGLPVVATDVGGQRENAQDGLELVAADATSASIAARLARLPVREALLERAIARAPRAWSLGGFPREAQGPSCETLFATANLNAGGAQRSLVNLATAISRGHSLAIAVCGETTHAAFHRQLEGAAVETFRPADDSDPFAVAESLLAHAGLRGARNICFWNAAPAVKLLIAKFAPPAVRILDASPGAYAFEEMEAAAPFAAAIAYSSAAYYRRLDALVLKYRAETHPVCARVAIIPNGVAPAAIAAMPSHPRFLVSGRIAPSKRLDTILEAFARIHARHPDAELHVVGNVERRHEDYAATLVERAARLPVLFRGAMFDLAHFGEPFTAAIVLGTHQGSPNAVLEAMAAGVPVIGNDSGGTRELVIDGATGWLLAEEAATASVERAMREAIANPGHARACAARARERMAAEFSIESMARRYLDLLEGGARREKMGAWNSATARAAPPPLSSAPSPTAPAS